MMNPKREANLEATIRELRKRLADAESKLDELQWDPEKWEEVTITEVKYDSPAPESAGSVEERQG